MWTVIKKGGFVDATWFVHGQYATKQEADKVATKIASKDPLDEEYFTLVVRGGKMVDYGLWQFTHKGEVVTAIDK